MFSRFTRLPLRRCLHTVPPRATHSGLRFALGASATAAATYLTWQLNADSQRISLDSATDIPPVKQSTTSKTSIPPRSTVSPPETSFVPDQGQSEPEAEIPPLEKSEGVDVSEQTPEGSEPEGQAEQGSGGAFNPVTGEINWDCPCLGGMAHGPCGPEFREAFSCFVFSEEEPKGINCVEKFQAMQTCFRAHPEVYGDEIMDDDDEEPLPVAEGAILTSSDSTEHQNEITEDNVHASQPVKTNVQKLE